MATRFRNIQGTTVHLYRPAGHPDSLIVEPDQVVEVPAKVSEELDDAWITGELVEPSEANPHGADNRLAWPKACWELEQPPESKPAKKDAAKPSDSSKEN